MQQFAGHFLAPPFPLIVLLAVGLLLGPARRAGHMLTAFGAAGLILCSVPLTGKLLVYPLLRFEREPSAPTRPAAILVPTGGAFSDEAGDWWPSWETIQRVARATTLQQRFDLPLFITGGSPDGDSPEEATVALRQLRLDPDAWWVDSTARDTHGNARAARRLLAAKGIRTVFLVTHEAHMARMAAALRHQGFAVLPIVAGKAKLSDVRWRDLVPSNAGFSYSRTAVMMYGGILLYLARGWIGVGDLAGPFR